MHYKGGNRMKQLELILYLIELESMTKQLIEGLQAKLMRDSLDRCSEAYLDGKLIEKKRLLYIIKDVKSLLNTEQIEQTQSTFNRLVEYKQTLQDIIDADEREMW